MEDDELKIQSVIRYFTFKQNNKSVKTKNKVVIEVGQSNLSKLLYKYNIHVPTHLDEVINQELIKKLGL